MKNFNVCFEIQSDFRYLPFLTRFFKALKLPKAIPLTQVLVEAYNNAVVHGHHCQRAKWITIDLAATSRQTRLRVIDQGKGIPKSAFKQRPGVWETRGRGLQIIAAHTTRVASIKRGKNHRLEMIVA